MGCGRVLEYRKTALSVEEQVSRLRDLGLRGDVQRMQRRLESVSYHRLKPYWVPFLRSEHRFRDNVGIEDVWNLYVFDRALRLLVLDALERIEVAVRAKLSCSLGQNYEAFGYAERPEVLWHRDPKRRGEVLSHLHEEVARSREQFVLSHFDKYGGEHLPVWKACEVVSFGTLCTMYRGCDRRVQGEVARDFGVNSKVMASWLLMLNVIRNLCAHHARLWNRELGVKPKLPFADQDSSWHTPVHIPNDRAFAVLTILCYCLHRIAPGSAWAERVAALLRKHPGISLTEMGFPEEWARSPIWTRMLK